ncbi:eukaryotic rRNA processing protein EBP2 [Colletotrichum graminicola]|uniref:Eukaryotic rRNA processing protein EBP2 n=1 Tax=Colletotrichum graminicola (strain M1.001 / M2 / FGSC 10212) TaxID=645133 RepID=E3QBB2_COLGM|nr:eukaryotic rRNA processing protein EBP2 [Colletotrichum graminicola M1.001]EFQ28150.1 eukaryotic rRNA processing protein EBP2 [Colletotrichum graminicola M1.001]WDK11848.1 eukaryotic rRNA processing protein EBP2 [Colletotrichum graminicola]
MVTKSKLKLALAAEKGVDLRKVKEQRKIKAKHRETAKEKEKKAKSKGANEGDDLEDEEMGEDNDDDASVISVEGEITLNAEFEDADSDEEEEDDEDEYDEEEDSKLDIEALDDTDSGSDSEIDMEEKIERPAKKTKTTKVTKKVPVEVEEKDGESEDDDDEDPEADDVPLSDLDADEEDLEDIVPHTKLTINNKTALLASLNRIRIDTSSAVPFATHQSVVSSKPTADAVPDVQDDLQRELALLSQSLEAARKGRSLLIKEGVPFSRPNDYFAEMAKDDGQMQKIKAKLVEEASAKKAAAEARKLRDLKKFGKQVQVAKLQERQKAKKDTLEKIKTLKRKRQEGSSNLDTHEADLFDVGVDNEIKSHTNSSGRRDGKRDGGRSGSGVNAKRAKKNEKYGFGGKKRHAKSGDAVSSGDLSAFNPKRMKGGIGKKPQQRPGKNRRKAMSNK